MSALPSNAEEAEEFTSDDILPSVHILPNEIRNGNGDKAKSLRQILGRVELWPEVLYGYEFRMFHTTDIQEDKIRLAVLDGTTCREIFFAAALNNRRYIEGLRPALNRTNLLVPLALPYPRSKADFMYNEVVKKVVFSTAKRIASVLNCLEDFAGWPREKRTIAYAAWPKGAYTRRNCATVLFSGAPQWGQCNYYTSLFLLLCRLLTNPLFQAEKDITTPDALQEWCKSKIKKIKALSMKIAQTRATSIYADASQIVRTYQLWWPLLLAYDKAFGDATRVDIYVKHINDMYSIVAYECGVVGISYLFNYGPPNFAATNKGILGNYTERFTRALLKHIPPEQLDNMPNAWSAAYAKFMK